MDNTPPVDEAVEAAPSATDKPLADLLNDLTGQEAATRLEAVQQLGRLEKADWPVLQALEKAAAQDDSAVVREAAMLALAAPVYRALQQRASRLPFNLRQILLAEIDRWVADGLLPPPTAHLLRQRYNFDQRPAPAASPAMPAAPAAPRPTLTQILLSETTIQVALYLGAFFVVAAAFIFAAIIEMLRLPILGLATVGFLGVALALKWRLPTASFVLFIVFSCLLPIDAAVLLDMLNVGETVAGLFWIVVAAMLCLVWAGGTFLYRSRFFSLLALAAGSVAMLLIGRWLDYSPHLDLLLIELPTLAALAGVVLLGRWQDRRFAWPLFGLAQLQQVMLLGISAILVLFTLIESDLPAAGWWPVIAFTWLLAALFYALSHRLIGLVFFPPLVVLALLPVPLLLAGVFSPSWQVVMTLAWIWGTGLALGGEGLGRVKWAGLAGYGLYLGIASVGMYLFAAVGGLFNQVAFGLGYLLGTAVVYLVLTLLRPRAWLWTATLIAATAAYFALFFLPSLQDYDFYPGLVMLWPGLVWLGFSLVARHWGQAQPRWHLPPLILGGLVGAVTVMTLLVTGFDEPLYAAIAFVIIAGFLALFGLVDRKPIIGYGATASLTAALVFGLIYLETEQWLLPLVGLASLYYVGGVTLALGGRTGGWAKMLRFSGLGLGVLASLGAPIQSGAGGVIGPALIATYFAIEAFRLRQVWWGGPANLLYLVAYFTLLIEMDVSQPQFFSVGAALLGFIMHYFLGRSGSKWSAFFTGLLSQFILLGTTYIQMFSTEQILYFFVLFGQAMVVLVYGLVVRSRSLVLAPLVFVVLGVITVTLSMLAGIPALLLVGCTGLMLLILGIIALVKRQQLLAATHKLGERLGGWQA